MQSLEKRVKALEQTKPSNFAHLTNTELEAQIEIYRALLAVESTASKENSHAKPRKKNC